MDKKTEKILIAKVLKEGFQNYLDDMKKITNEFGSFSFVISKHGNEPIVSIQKPEYEEKYAEISFDIFPNTSNPDVDYWEYTASELGFALANLVLEECD